jgi:hypothetical protein
MSDKTVDISKIGGLCQYYQWWVISQPLTWDPIKDGKQWCDDHNIKIKNNKISIDDIPSDLVADVFRHSD